MRLKNKIAVITGSGRGIGRAIALEMAKEGAKIVVTSNTPEECDLVSKEIAGAGSESICVKCDVSKSEEVENLMEKTVEKWGRIDILVNNAGVVRQKPLIEMSEEDWDFVMDINLKGAFLCSKAAAQKMIDQKSGKIISISSIAGEVGFPNTSAYCASKGGMTNLTREMSLELAPFNINVNGIAPGVIRTKMTEDMLEDSATKEALLAQIPCGRAGEPEEIGKVAVFLASDEASYITGQTVVVDGGWLAK